jgi:hypothetical protein
LKSIIVGVRRRENPKQSNSMEAEPTAQYAQQQIVEAGPHFIDRSMNPDIQIQERTFVVPSDKMMNAKDGVKYGTNSNDSGDVAVERKFCGDNDNTPWTELTEAESFITSTDGSSNNAPSIPAVDISLAFSNAGASSVIIDLCSESSASETESDLGNSDFESYYRLAEVEEEVLSQLNNCKYEVLKCVDQHTDIIVECVDASSKKELERSIQKTDGDIVIDRQRFGNLERKINDLIHLVEQNNELKDKVQELNNLAQEQASTIKILEQSANPRKVKALEKKLQQTEERSDAIFHENCRLRNHIAEIHREMSAAVKEKVALQKKLQRALSGE